MLRIIMTVMVVAVGIHGYSIPLKEEQHHLFGKELRKGVNKGENTPKPMDEETANALDKEILQMTSGTTKRPEDGGEPNLDDIYLCCTPTQWEANFDEFGVVSFLFKRVNVAKKSKIFYDADKKMVAVESHYFSEQALHQTEPVKFLLHFHEKKMYIIYGEKADHCKVKDIKLPYKPACISTGAIELGKMFVGEGKSSTPLTKFYSMKKDIHVVQIVTDRCIPVGEILYTDGAKEHVKVISNMAFHGIVTGIKDPRVFERPTSCDTAVPYPEVRGDTLRYQTQLDDMIAYVLDKFTE